MGLFHPALCPDLIAEIIIIADRLAVFPALIAILDALIAIWLLLCSSATLAALLLNHDKFFRFKLLLGKASDMQPWPFIVFWPRTLSMLLLKHFMTRLRLTVFALLRLQEYSPVFLRLFCRPLFTLGIVTVPLLIYFRMLKKGISQLPPMVLPDYVHLHLEHVIPSWPLWLLRMFKSALLTSRLTDSVLWPDLPTRHKLPLNRIL